MKFDAPIDKSPLATGVTLAWLTDQTISTLQRAGEDGEGLKASAFLFVNRAREAGISDQEMANVIRVSIVGAALSKAQEGVVLDWVNTFDPIATGVHADAPPRKHWWQFWV